MEFRRKPNGGDRVFWNVEFSRFSRHSRPAAIIFSGCSTNVLFDKQWECLRGKNVKNGETQKGNKRTRRLEHSGVFRIINICYITHLKIVS